MAPLDDSALDEHSAREITRRVTRAGAVHGEGILSYCRLFFCSAVLLRFSVYVEEIPWAAIALNGSALLVGIAFSVFVISARRAGKPLTFALRVGGVVDAVVAFCSLLQTALWNPLGPGYAGLLTVPDVSILPLLVFTAAFRFSPKLAALSGALNSGSLLVLLAVDRARLGSQIGYGTAQLSIFVLVLATAALASVAMAVKVRQLVVAAAGTSLRVEEARAAMTDVLRDQHDARSLLSAAHLHAELVHLALRDPQQQIGPSAAAWAESLLRDLGDVSASLRVLSDRTFAQLSALHEPQVADACHVVPQVLAVLRSRFRQLSFVERIETLEAVRLRGGNASLQRLLFNLVVNAVEGNGERGASAVQIHSYLDRAWLCIEVSDDGPGFPPGVSEIGDACVSSKMRGSGLGLFGMRLLVQASGGELSVVNRGSGATVVLRLVTAGARGARPR